MLAAIIAMRKSTGFITEKKPVNNKPAPYAIKLLALEMLRKGKSATVVGLELGVNKNSVRNWGQDAEILKKNVTCERREKLYLLIKDNPYKYQKKDLCKILSATKYAIDRDLSYITNLVKGDKEGFRTKYAII